MANAGTYHPTGSTPGVVGRAFYLRMAENAFRRLPLLLLPVIAVALIGVTIATRSSPPYRTSGVLSAASNPLFDTVVNTTALQAWETPAAATSRLINEQLRSDTFTATVADEAGLGDLLEAGLITPDVIRANVWASADGSTLLSITATWSDPETTAALVNATIKAYTDERAESLASDSAAAVTFHEQRRQDAELEVQRAEQEYTSYVDSLEPMADDQVRPYEEQLRLEQLSKALERAQTQVSDAEAEIATAQLAVDQSRSEAGRNLRVIDQPKIPSQPESTLIKRVITIIVFISIGMLISGVALFLTTLLDQSVRTAADLEQVALSDNISVVPVIRQRPRSQRSDAREAREAADDRTTPRESVTV